METPHPPSLREGTFSHKGRRKEDRRRLDYFGCSFSAAELMQ
jgi:hypothetical protein